MSEISYLLFQAVMLVTFLACSAYSVFFVRQKSRVRNVARILLVTSGILQTLYILSRYQLVGHAPITSQHETVVVFAWATTWAPRLAARLPFPRVTLSVGP